MTAPERGLDAAIRRAGAAGSSDLVLIGVDGPSGSGKSTLARAIATALDAPLIAVDDFLAWNEYERWWPYFVEAVLDPLAAGAEVRFHARDWAGDEFGDAMLVAERVVPRAPVVVVEGVTGTRVAGAGRWTLTVWVEAPAAERLRRGVERDGADHHELWVEAIERERIFFEGDGARERAHLVVDGTTGALLIERP